ncbi:MAG: hypothetical protein J6O40_00425 [Ruminococcus sp.]|nr:hypothetical protein [Ruminococcus sp.]
MENINLIGIVGLIIIVFLYILMKRSQKKHPEKYNTISKKQAVIFVLPGGAAVVGTFLLLAGFLKTV